MLSLHCCSLCCFGVDIGALLFGIQQAVCISSNFQDSVCYVFVFHNVQLTCLKEDGVTEYQLLVLQCAMSDFFQFLYLYFSFCFRRGCLCSYLKSIGINYIHFAIWQYNVSLWFTIQNGSLSSLSRLFLHMSTIVTTVYFIDSVSQYILVLVPVTHLNFS